MYMYTVNRRFVGRLSPTILSAPNWHPLPLAERDIACITFQKREGKQNCKCCDNSMFCMKWNDCSRRVEIFGGKEKARAIFNNLQEINGLPSDRLFTYFVAKDKSHSTCIAQTTMICINENKRVTFTHIHCPNYTWNGTLHVPRNIRHSETVGLGVTLPQNLRPSSSKVKQYVFCDHDGTRTPYLSCSSQAIVVGCAGNKKIARISSSIYCGIGSLSVRPIFTLSWINFKITENENKKHKTNLSDLTVESFSGPDRFRALWIKIKFSVILRSIIFYRGLFFNETERIFSFHS